MTELTLISLRLRRLLGIGEPGERKGAEGVKAPHDPYSCWGSKERWLMAV